MTQLDEFFRIGLVTTLGSHTFGADEIKAFARKYDPQPFHVDEEAARLSVFGGLCASGWHTASMWMKYNLITRTDLPERWSGPDPMPQYGPSPGFKNLKWSKPVYAGDTITFLRTALDHRVMASRPGYRIINIRAEAVNAKGDRVIEFDNAVLVDVGVGNGEWGMGNGE